MEPKLVGAVLVAALAVFAAAFPGYRRGRFDSRFWALPLEEKLPRIAEHRREWRYMSASGVLVMAVVVAGMAGFSALLAREGRPGLAWASFGAFLVGAVAWMIGELIQGTAVTTAADRAAESGSVPDWLAPWWAFAWWSELTWLVIGDLAHVGWGAAMVMTGFPAVWMGWVAIGLGGGALVGVLIARDGFPQLPVLVPIVLGFSLLLS